MSIFPIFDLFPLFVTLSFVLWTWILHLLHRLIKVNKYTGLFQNPLTDTEVMAQKCISFHHPCFRLTSICDLSCKLWTWFMGMTHCLIKVSKYDKLFQNSLTHKEVITQTSIVLWYLDFFTFYLQNLEFWTLFMHVTLWLININMCAL